MSYGSTSNIGTLNTETNQQYYQGAQVFQVTNPDGQSNFTTTFETNLIFGSFDPSDTDYVLNNFKIYISDSGLPGSFQEYITEYSVSNNIISLGTTSVPVVVPLGKYIVVQF